FDHDDGGVDDQAEIDRTDRQQVSRFPAQHENDDREKQRERYRRADDQRGTQIPEEQLLQNDNRNDGTRQVLQHRFRRRLDQVLPIVNPLDLDPGRENGGFVDGCHEFFDPRDGWRALLAAPHQHDALDNIVIVVFAGDAKSRLLADGDGGDVLDQHRGAVVRGDHGVGQVVDRTDQTDAAHDRRLRADVEGVAADIDVRIADCLHELRQCQPVGDQLVEIDLKFVGLGPSAPAGDVDHAGYRLESAI